MGEGPRSGGEGPLHPVATAKPYSLVVDTDCGVDDALALLLLLASPEVDLRAVTTTHGSGPVDQVTANVLRILELAGRADVPVHAGAARPLLRDPVYAPHVHGQNGLGDAALPAPTSQPSGAAIDFYLELDEPVAVLTLGPLTNIAVALAARPALRDRITRVVAMAGAVWVPGNVTPAAESNLWKDPEAAAIVLGAGGPADGRSVPLHLVPLDATRQLTVSAAELAALPDPMPRITAAYLDFHRRTAALDGIYLNDPAAAAYLLRPELFESDELYVEVDWQGPLTTGKLLARPSQPVGRGHRATLALRPDVAAVRRLILDRLSRRPG